jgi:hypothetical protein
MLTGVISQVVEAISMDIYISIVIPTAPRIRPFKRKTVEKNSQLKTGYVLSEEKILQ